MSKIAIIKWIVFNDVDIDNVMLYWTCGNHKQSMPRAGFCTLSLTVPSRRRIRPFSYPGDPFSLLHACNQNLACNKLNFSAAKDSAMWVWLMLDCWLVELGNSLKLTSHQLSEQVLARLSVIVTPTWKGRENCHISCSKTICLPTWN